MNYKPKCVFLCERANTPSLGAEYLFSVLRANGYPTTVLFDDHVSSPWSPPHKSKAGIGSLARRFVDENCGVLFASVNTDYFSRALSIIKAIKEIDPDIVTCVGGPHATYAHEQTIANDCIDFLCRGEGEIAILEFLEMLGGKRSDLPSGIYRSIGCAIEGAGFGTLVADLDMLPYPDKSDYYQAIPQVRATYSIMTGRGCFNKCTYCNSSTVRAFYRREGTNFLRRRSVGDVIQELRMAKEIYKPTNVYFCDDAFIFNKKYMAEFAERYAAEIGLPYFCSSTPNFFDEEIMTKLAEGGLAMVEVGIQTMDEDTRKRIFNRPESNEDFARYVSLLKKVGVQSLTDHIINPWDSIDSLKKQIESYDKVGQDQVNVYYLMYYPSTHVIENALADGFLSEAEKEDMYYGKLKGNYYFGSSLSKEDIHRTKDLAMLLRLVQWLPSFLIRFLLRKDRYWVLRYVPETILLPMRFFKAVFNKADILGRNHVKNLIFTLFMIRPKVSQYRIDKIRGISLYKEVAPFEGAVPTLRPIKTGTH